MRGKYSLLIDLLLIIPSSRAYIQVSPSDKVVFENIDAQRSVTNVKIKNLTFHRVAFKVIFFL